MKIDNLILINKYLHELICSIHDIYDEECSCNEGCLTESELTHLDNLYKSIMEALWNSI